MRYDSSVAAEITFKFGEKIHGDCTDEDFMKQIGIDVAKGIFVTTRDDHKNIVICLTARQLSNSLRIVSQCQNPESIKKLKMVGANKVISTALIGGLRMASEMVRPTVTTFLDEMLRDTNLNLRIEELKITDQFHGKSISDLPMGQLKDTLLLAIREEHQWKYNPPTGYRLSKDSALILMTSPDELQKLEKLMQ